MWVWNGGRGNVRLCSWSCIPYPSSLPTESRAWMGPSLTRCNRETRPGPQGNIPSPSKCTGIPLAGNMHPHVWVGCRDTASTCSGKHPSHICHLCKILHPCGYTGVPLRNYSRRHWSWPLHPAAAQWSSEVPWKSQTQTWPNLEVCHQEARLSSTSHIPLARLDASAQVSSRH